MSKRSRTFQPSTGRPDAIGETASNDGLDGSGETAETRPAPPASSSASAGSTARAEARRRAAPPKAAPQASFIERYKLLIVGGAGVVIVLLGLVFFTRSSTRAYECLTFLTPAPVAPSSPVPGQSPLLGFQTQDMGKDHTVQGATIKYAYCPPASGGHYNLGGGQAPLARRFFGPTDSVIPPQWIHNLEHGNVVLLYRGDPGTEVLDQLRSVMDEAAISDWSLANCGPVNKVIAARFDDMDPQVKFAALAWDRALLLEQFDRAALLAFANQWQDGPQTPERTCA